MDAKNSIPDPELFGGNTPDEAEATTPDALARRGSKIYGAASMGGYDISWGGGVGSARLNPQQSINDPDDECTLLKYTILKSIPFERSTSFGVHPKIEALLKIKNSRIWITVDTIEKPVLCAKPLRL
ncbi:hypothetical protein EYC84_010363 [Monilinia fructicola]|uniref:Uncharacterized protein n=1 Tax=Monilinia fructicola TaxID=38448 RepID=A0A5M9JG87_MONFR|nr:hypothetical protein EYC84_010363 [Monilinia fructicola]